MTWRLRRLAALVVTSLIASGCISVADFGAYWNKDPLDVGLAGVWVALKTPDGDRGELIFIRRGALYDLSVREDNDKAKPAGEQVRTLRVGDATFLLSRGRGKRGGMMTAYRFTPGRLEILDVPAVAASDGVPPPPPSVTYRHGPGAPPSIDIATLDPAALEWLAALAQRSTATSVFRRH